MQEVSKRYLSNTKELKIAFLTILGDNILVLCKDIKTMEVTY